MKKPGSGPLDWFLSLKLLIAVGVVFGVAIGIFVVAGGVDVSADRPDGPISRTLLHFVFNRSEASRASVVAPPADLSSPYRVRLAAQHFDMVCANCHGRPGFGQSVVALSLSPRPQYLPKVVGQFTDSELFEIVQHGVKYSGMPSWPTNARDDEVWSMVAFLRQLPKLDAKTYHDWTALPDKADAPLANPADNPVLQPANAGRNEPPYDEFQYAAPASGFADQGFHQNPVATCVRCHGADGSGAVTGGEAPNLTIQDPAYLRAALEAYIKGSRKSGFMQNIAAQLSEAQIGPIADYYAGLPVKTVSSTPVDPALFKRGEQIATEGLREHAIPACATCHESQGGKILGAPHIAGQSATYLRRELVAMRLGGRGSSVWWNPMPAEAHGLGDKDIAAVAAYYAAQKPAKAAGGGSAAPALQPAALDTRFNGKLEGAKQIFAAQCEKCHVNGGRGDLAGGYPNLTIQSAPYLAQSLYSFRTRARPNSKMTYVIDSLTFDDMTGLAHYLDSLKPQRALAKLDPAAASRGEAIALHGIQGRGVPACMSCHDAKGEVALPLIPRLQGQSAPYLYHRLNVFAGPSGANLTALNPMPSIAIKLSDQERADLAAYFASAPLVDKPRPGQIAQNQHP